MNAAAFSFKFGMESKRLLKSILVNYFFMTGGLAGKCGILTAEIVSSKAFFGISRNPFSGKLFRQCFRSKVSPLC